MNNSFEQLFKKNHTYKDISTKNIHNNPTSIKKQPKPNPSSKNKHHLTSTSSHYPNDLYQSSVITNASLQKNIHKNNPSKSHQKRTSKHQDKDNTNTTAHKKNKHSSISSIIKKSPTIQLTKKQKEIRQAIQYRFDKSKMKSYKFHSFSKELQQTQDLIARQIIDDQEQSIFAQTFGYLANLKVVNLYEYSKFKEEELAPQKQKSKQKIIVIKNTKKKRQNSDTILSFNNFKDQEFKLAKQINTKLILNPNSSQYFSNNPIQSQRNHTESAVNYHQRNKSDSPSQNLKLQFPSSKNFQKPKNGSRPKIKTQYSVGLNEKIINSSSVEKNFKSIKDIYLNAISNLANKNTVKNNNKLFRSQNSEARNKGSKSVLYESEKKPNKNQYQSAKPDKNSGSSSALQQNYFSCASSRDHNKKQDKYSSFYNRKVTQQKLDKTLLINEVNSSQWKSVIMKVDDTFKSQTKESAGQPSNENRKFKLKLKDSGFQRGHKSGMNTAHGKFMIQPHSYRQYTKSPKFKRYVINEDDEKEQNRRIENGKNVNSVKNLTNQAYQNLLNESTASMQEQLVHTKKGRK